MKGENNCALMGRMYRLCSNTGIWAAWFPLMLLSFQRLRDVQKRVLEKTAALARWAQAQALPLPLLAKLWVIIVENAVLWLLAALPLQTHHLFACDKIQRKAGRILLG